MSEDCYSIPQPCGGWFRKKHDWVTLEEVVRDYPSIYYRRAVCLKCERILDEITPLLEREKAAEERREKRRELAEKIYNEKRKK